MVNTLRARFETLHIIVKSFLLTRIYYEAERRVWLFGDVPRAWPDQSISCFGGRETAESKMEEEERKGIIGSSLGAEATACGKFASPWGYKFLTWGARRSPSELTQN